MLDVAAAQIDGKRDYQEDAYKVILNQASPAHFVVLLADGMGGHAAGDVAANSTIAAFSKCLTFENPPYHTQFLQCLDQANRELANMISQNPKYSGMGCTFVGLEIYNNQCTWISVGDSPLFHIRGNTIKQVNADHSMASQLDASAKIGEITKEEASNSPSRNMLLSALTGDKISRVDHNRVALDLDEGDWLILGSDGIQTLELNQILEIKNKNSAGSASSLLNFLMSEIIKRDSPNQDNATAVVIQINQPAVDINEAQYDEVTTRPIIR